MVGMVGMFGPGGLAALFVVPTGPVSRVLRRVAVVLTVRVTFLQAVVTSRVRVSWLAEGSPCACLALLRPARIIAASCRGGVMMMMVLMMLGMVMLVMLLLLLLRAVAPVIPRTAAGVAGPAVEPR